MPVDALTPKVASVEQTISIVVPELIWLTWLKPNPRYDSKCEYIYIIFIATEHVKSYLLITNVVSTVIIWCSMIRCSPVWQCTAYTINMHMWYTAYWEVCFKSYLLITNVVSTVITWCSMIRCSPVLQCTAYTINMHMWYTAYWEVCFKSYLLITNVVSTVITWCSMIRCSPSMAMYSIYHKHAHVIHCLLRGLFHWHNGTRMITWWL